MLLESPLGRELAKGFECGLRSFDAERRALLRLIEIECRAKGAFEMDARI
jgi:hypothetical protein